MFLTTTNFMKLCGGFSGGEQLLKGGLKGTQLPQQETPIR